MRVLRRILVVIALSYLGLCAVMFFMQRSMQYRPNPSPMNPASVSLPQAHQSTIETSDGERIVTWWIAPKDAAKPVFLYLHGNGASLHNRAARFAKLTDSGAGLLAVSYRGYGGSTGTPTERGIMIDARAAYDSLVKAQRLEASRIVLFGESLGTTVATMLAAEVPVAALFLDSSFDSALDVAARAYPWLPVRWLLRDPFRADLAAAKVSVPVQQVHCGDDPVTPLGSAELLTKRFTAAKPIHVLQKRCHVPPIDDYMAVLSGFVKSVMSRPL